MGHRRRRICDECGHRITTYEIALPDVEAVVLYPRRGQFMNLEKIAPDIDLYRIVPPPPPGSLCLYCMGYGDESCPACRGRHTV